MPFTDVSSSLTMRSPGLDPGARRGRVVDRRDDLDEAVFHADFDAEPAELALRPDLQFAERLLVEIRRMRIESRQHAVDRFGDELLVLDRLDVVALDAAEDFGERAQLFDRAAAQHRFALGDRREIEADQHADATRRAAIKPN